MVQRQAIIAPEMKLDEAQPQGIPTWGSVSEGIASRAKQNEWNTIIACSWRGHVRGPPKNCQLLTKGRLPSRLPDIFPDLWVPQYRFRLGGLRRLGEQETALPPRRHDLQFVTSSVWLPQPSAVLLALSCAFRVPDFEARLRPPACLPIHLP